MGVDDADFLREARERFQLGIDGDIENRKRDDADRRFFKGEQWTKEEVKERAGRITVRINRLPQFVKQVTGEMRQNKPAIKVLPVDDQTDPKLAEVYSAIVRHIESVSDAHRIYNKAAEQSVIGGIGWFRILTDYLDDTSFDQEILVKHVRNPLSVVHDPDARELTRQDMNWAFITELMSRKKFEKAYPKVSLTGFDNPTEYESQWIQRDTIRIAEYWYREKVAKTLAMFSDGSTRFLEKGDEQAIAEANAQLSQMGGQPIGITATREAETYKVCSCRMTGTAVIDRSEWKGRWIPLVPVIGEEVEVGDEIFRHGLVHHAKDAQRSYNFARSAMMEHVGSQPKAPWLVTANQIKNYKTMWENANKGNPPVLVYDPDPQAPGPPQRQMPPTMASAWYQEAEVADGDMKATTGIYDASLGRPGNETSGRAIIARDKQGETATYAFVDNLTASIRHAGNLLIDLIPHIYSDERVIRIVGEDGAIEEYARINTQLPDGRTFNDISVGRYDVEVTTGPAYATKRQEAADKMMQLLQTVPAIGQLGGDMIVKALDIPYGDKLAERLAVALVPPGLDDDADKKRAEMQQKMGPTPPSPEQQAAQAELQLQQQKIQGEQQAMQVRLQIAQQEGQAKIQLMQADSAAKLDLQRQQGQQDAMLAQQKADAEYQIAIRQQDAEEALAERKMALEERLATHKASLAQSANDAKISSMRAGGELDK